MRVYDLNNAEYSAGDFKLSIANIAIEQGKIYSVVGPNGAGKSSLLNLLAFLWRPSSGRLRFREEEVGYSDKSALLSLRREIGYVMQNPYLFNMSVFDNVAYGLKVRRVPSGDTRRRVEAILDRMSLSHLARRNARCLSGGEAQRVALARTLAIENDVALLDEPTANVDRVNAQLIEKTLMDICRERKATVVLATHSLDQAYRLSGNVLSIINGRVSGAAYENVFEAPVRQDPTGVLCVPVAKGITFLMAGGMPSERATVAIDPEDIIVSHERLSSSALNAFQGVIVRVDAADSALRVFVDIGVNLCALVTRRSFHELGLNVGSGVWLSFKATALRCLSE